MKKSVRNKIVGFFCGVALLVGLTSVVVPQEQAQAQYIYTCYAENNFGSTFYWNHFNPAVAQTNAMRACRLNTPVGGICVFRGCE